MARSICIALMAMTALTVIFTVSSESLDQDRLELPLLEKRPFCNAFTGCGRKRSNERGDYSTRRQNRLYALLRQKMAEIDALRGLMDENE